jgi:hypothetical protein
VAPEGDTSKNGGGVLFKQTQTDCTGAIFRLGQLRHQHLHQHFERSSEDSFGPLKTGDLRPLASVPTTAREAVAVKWRWRRGQDGKPELGIHPTGSGRPCLWWSSGLVDQQHPAKAWTCTAEGGGAACLSHSPCANKPPLTVRSSLPTRLILRRSG